MTLIELLALQQTFGGSRKYYELVDLLNKLKEATTNG